MKNIITRIEVGKRNKNRVNVYINYEYTFSCNAELVYKFNLSKDEEIDLEYIKELVIEDNYLSCKESALNTISRTYKTEKEMKDKLKMKGYDESSIDRVMSFLKEYTFIDDNKYAEMYIKDNCAKSGRNKIKYNLSRKGIKEDLIQEKLSLIDEEGEFNSVMELAKKKYNILKKSQDDKYKINGKLVQFLLRRGFKYDIIKNVLNDLLEN
ncbi:recombination regulator RecX [Clostridium sp. DL1XJH146]